MIRIVINKKGDNMKTPSILQAIEEQCKDQDSIDAFYELWIVWELSQTHMDISNRGLEQDYISNNVSCLI